MNYETFQASLQKLIGHYTSGEFKEELTLAKKEFFDNTGSLDENKSTYNLRMYQFYEWYFLTRPLKSYMKTPQVVSELQRGLRLTDEDREALDILKTQHHTFFEFIKSKNDFIYIKDLVTNKKIEVHQTDLIFGFDQKEYFQSRVVKIKDQFFFLKSFCFHPESAQKFILAQIKLHQKNPDLNIEDLLLRLNKMRYKFEQYKHVKPEMIYTNDNKLGL
ncbi:MAG: hypothetical protein H7061_07730 [Bdellovibrionaceae bacterium]|nr:hypothetical protein [Bdellovibrio sp.]